MRKKTRKKNLKLALKPKHTVIRSCRPLASSGVILFLAWCHFYGMNYLPVTDHCQSFSTGSDFLPGKQKDCSPCSLVSLLSQLSAWEVRIIVVCLKFFYQNFFPVFLHQTLQTRHVTTIKSSTLIRVVGATRLCASLKSRMNGWRKPQVTSGKKFG